MLSLPAVCVLLLLALQTPTSQSAKVLVLFPTPAKSHDILGKALSRGLAENGHEVTMVSMFKMDNPPANYTDLLMGDLRSALSSSTTKPKSFFDMVGDDPFETVISLYHTGYLIASASLTDPVFTQLLNSKTKYDVVICEAFLNEVFFLFARHFNAHLIAFSTIGPSEWTYYLSGNPQPYAYVPHGATDYTHQMTYTQRAYNTFLSTFNTLALYWYHLPKQDTLVQKYFPGSPPLSEYIPENVRLVLLNSHLSHKNPEPLVPNMIEIGGFHVQPPKTLPKDLQLILDNAKQGVIYFSLGSNIQAKDMNPAVRDALLKAFAERKELILWKWEDENLPGKPGNVVIRRWFPQSDLLAHPNVKVFMTHGGLLSTMEALSRGVPLLGIPIFGDQMINMQRAQTFGYGLRLDYQNISAESLRWSLNQITSNPRYTNQAKQNSAILKDQPISPIKSAAYWVDYVVRHNGAPHLRVAAVDMPFYQLLLLDILVPILLIIFVIFAISCYILRQLYLVLTRPPGKAPGKTPVKAKPNKKVD